MQKESGTKRWLKNIEKNSPRFTRILRSFKKNPPDFYFDIRNYGNLYKVDPDSVPLILLNGKEKMHIIYFKDWNVMRINNEFEIVFESVEEIEDFLYDIKALQEAGLLPEERNEDEHL